MRHPSDSDPRDALNDYLDALAGAPPAKPSAGRLDPELRDDVDRFFDLAERAGMVTGELRRPTMNATLPASTNILSPSVPARRNVHLLAWTRHLHLASTGLLIAVVIALSIVAYGPNGIGNGDNGTGSNGTGDGPSLNGAVPIATIPEAEYTNDVECTVEPMTRDELVAQLKEANQATRPALPRYERSIEPTSEDAAAITQTYREWRACGDFARQMRFQTAWYSAQLPVFLTVNGENLRPVSDDAIEAWVDAVLQPESAATPTTGSATPPMLHGAQERVQVPAGSTPAAPDYGGGHGIPTLLPGDIVMTGPDTAVAMVYFVVPETGEVMVVDPQMYQFVKVDGVWLINEYIQNLG